MFIDATLSSAPQRRRTREADGSAWDASGPLIPSPSCIRTVRLARAVLKIIFSGGARALSQFPRDSGYEDHVSPSMWRPMARHTLWSGGGIVLSAHADSLETRTAPSRLWHRCVQLHKMQAFWFGDPSRRRSLGKAIAVERVSTGPADDLRSSLRSSSDVSLGRRTMRRLETTSDGQAAPGGQRPWYVRCIARGIADGTGRLQDDEPAGSDPRDGHRSLGSPMTSMDLNDDVLSMGQVGRRMAERIGSRSRIGRRPSDPA